MSELGKMRLGSRLLQYRYLHCRNRARTRYGIDLTPEQYDNLCSAFQSPGDGIWRTDTGDLEGWLPLGDSLVLAHYRPAEGLILTLLDPPDDTVDLDLSILEVSSRERSLLVELRKAREELKKIRTFRIWDQQAGRDFLIGDYVIYLKNKIMGASMAQDVGTWYKSQINKSLKYIKDGDLDMARALLVCIASAPVGFDPTQDPKKASELLELLAREKVDFWKNSSKST